MTTSQKAAPPFDQDTADVILRSSDAVDYYVHSVILAQASPFFRAMFTLPQPEGSDNTLPIVDCEETSNVLQSLLTICYPILKPSSRPFEELEPTIRAAQKYEMELPIEYLKSHLRNTISIFNRPSNLQVWVAACRLHLEDIAQHAAISISSSCSLETVDASQLDGVTAANFFRLREYCLQYRRSTSPLTPLLSPPPVSESQTMAPSDSDTCPCVLNGDDPDSFSSTVPFPDLICRSSDGRDFLAHRAVLAMASSVLRDRLAATAPPVSSHHSPATSALSVLCFDEKREVFIQFLDICCYLRLDTMPSNPTMLAALIAAAHKYDIDHATKLLRPPWEAAAQTEPIRAYYAAASLGLSEYAQAVLPVLLRKPSSIFHEYVPEMESAPAVAFQRLFAYYKACNTAVGEEIAKVKEEHPEPLTYPSGLAFGMPAPANPATPHAFSAFGVSQTSRPAPPPEPRWFLHTFLSRISQSNAHGPAGQVQEANAILHEYLQWRNAGKPNFPDYQEEGKVVIELAQTLPQRLDRVLTAVRALIVACSKFRFPL
ncbi:hypothetical protein C8Q76DRAFT_716259 [Earliella scabrosa]|nr:hypothetical protein C8Q76DRAFT_716259 [Earliella scabrosa]